MNAIFLVGALYLLALTNGLPKPQNIVPGVFIPADVLKNLQDRANANSQPNTNVQTAQIVSNVQNPQPVTSQVYIPSTNVQTPSTTNVQNPQISYQPVYTNQPQYQTVIAAPAPQGNTQVQPTVVGRLGGVISNQPVQQTSQPTQSVIYVQQPQPTQQTIYVPQTSQPAQQTILVPQNSQSAQQTVLVPQTSQPVQQTILIPQTSQPAQQTYVSQPSNQGVVVQNAQPSQQTRVIFANPSSGNQVQSQNSNPVYTLIPLSGQNFNLVPLQSGSNPVVVSSG